MMSNQPQQHENFQDDKMKFEKKVWLVAGIASLVIVILWILKLTYNALLLILAGILIAVFFNRLAHLIQRKTNWKYKVCLPISILGTFIIIGLLSWFVGYRVQQQIAQLTETLPTTFQNAKAQLSQTPLGSKIVDGSTFDSNKLSSFASRFFRSSFGVLGDLYVIIFLGIFLTISPAVYMNGAASLVPKKSEGRAKELFEKLGVTLGDWLKGKIFAMFVVAVLTGIGLYFIGLPMILALSLIAGILNFVPNFGPLVAMIPAVLVGLMQGTNTALLVAGLYVFVQFVESNIITPSIQKKLIDMPPALILIGQLIIGTIAGAWGIILSTPLVAILIVVVNQLYVKQKDKA